MRLALTVATGLPAMALALALALAACGMKGPLYLPDKGGKVVTSPPAASGTPSAPTQPPAGTPGQPAQNAPAEATPATTPPSKKSDKDGDSQTQTPPQ